MLRREPTKITLTADDLTSYDTRKAQRDQERQHQERAAANQFRGQTAAMNGATPRNAHDHNPDPFARPSDRDARSRVLGPRS